MAFVTVAAVASIVGTGIKAVGGVVKAVDSGIKAKRAKEEAEEAQNQLEKQKEMFMHLDTSNPYLGMENVGDDLVVNKQQAEFEKQQQMQSQANIMDSMSGAAGGSGIAALAQSMANQGSMDAQKSSASIGAQESDNQMLQAREEARIQGLEIKGEKESRQMEHDKLNTVMGMTEKDAMNAKKEQAMYKQRMGEGMQQVGSAAGEFVTGGIGGEFGGTGVGNYFQRGMKGGV